MKKEHCSPFLILSILMLMYTELLADSGGLLSPAQAAYDVNYYDLQLTIDPDSKTIDGSLLCRVEIVNPIDTLVLDLDNPFTVDSVLATINDGLFNSVIFQHADEQLFIHIPETVEAGDFVSVQVFYNGAPRIANNPPWGVGFVWETTSTGKDWIGVACEDEGADIWWPCKDHPTDEPDSMSMSFTVPNPLICVSNGRYMGTIDNGNNTSTFNWFISTPINNYNVSIYAAEYALIEDDYYSVSGDTIPFYFAVLPEDSLTAANYMDVFLTEFDFLESICGPFPFGTDKHGWAHSSYWGMEHQTIIAYGHNFTVNSWGYDYIHYHELAHEWWGNLITAKDWADVWIHEGMATYTEALYVEHMSGMDAYLMFMYFTQPNDNHSHPLAPREAMTASDAFNYLNSYNRGASVIHTLRYHIGDDHFFNLFERWAYPDSTDYDNTNGRQCRILTTDDMMEQAEEETGKELEAFFEVFFREAAYPELYVVREVDSTTFSWETETNVLLDLNVPIRFNGIDTVVQMIDGKGSVQIMLEDELDIDPDHWILMADPSIVVGIEGEPPLIKSFQLEQNYPNPFSNSSTIKYTIPRSSEKVTLQVFDLMGNEVLLLVNDKQEPGTYKVCIDGTHLTDGNYYYRLQAGSFIETKKLVLIK